MLHLRTVKHVQERKCPACLIVTGQIECEIQEDKKKRKRRKKEMIYLLFILVRSTCLDSKITIDRRHLIQVDLSQEEVILTFVTRNLIMDQIWAGIDSDVQVIVK